jgi:GNAT superfamily N-acetyltransferase
MKFHKIALTERQLFQPGIAAIEKIATYPLGDDFFQIHHGNDYFAFFDRLGKVDYYVMCDSERVAAVGAGILREIPCRQGQLPQLAWYLCDLKVHPDYQRRNLSLQILSRAIAAGRSDCARGYLISMNPGDGSPNRLVRVLEKYSVVKFTTATQLNIYSLDAKNMREISPLIIKYRGKIAYRSLAGIKDLQLQSTGQKLPLLHLQWGGDIDDLIPEPITGYTHMFCVPSNDTLASLLTDRSIYPNATASVVSHGMAESDWQFILTSDI